MQIILYFLSVFVIFLVFKPNSISSKIISAILSILWLWMGIVYHIIFFTEINNAAYLFGSLFIIQGILFFIMGVLQSKFSFQLQKNNYGIIGIFLIAFALIIYPLLGFSLGHIYPTSPTFGLPCPTTIFTFGLLLLNIKKCPVAILIIPILWSMIGVAAAFQLGIFEDIGMIVSCLVTIILLIHRNKILRANKNCKLPKI